MTIILMVCRTGKGVNAMLIDYLGFYSAYINKIKQDSEATTMVNDESIADEEVNS